MTNAITTRLLPITSVNLISHQTMAAADVQSQLTMPQPRMDGHGNKDMVPLSRSTGTCLTPVPERPKFDPARHLRYSPPSERHSFTEFGLEAKPPPSDTCITEPFNLFTAEAVRLMRRELFQPAVFDNYMHSWARAPCVVRGIAPTVRYYYSTMDSIISTTFPLNLAS